VLFVKNNEIRRKFIVDKTKEGARNDNAVYHSGFFPGKTSKAQDRQGVASTPTGVY
jgi:hypothetical protein